MPCFVPFNSENLDITFFAFRPTGALTDELVDSLKYFSFFTEDLGCTGSSVFRSIHGNMVIWYGAWIKRSGEKRKLLRSTLVSTLTNISELAILTGHGFLESYAGESKDGQPTAKFSSGDTISMHAMVPISGDPANLSYACLALLKSFFMGTDGISSSMCFRCHDRPMVASLQVWKSLHACYTWFLQSDYKATMSPYIRHLSNDVRYDVFKVVYVSSDDFLNVRLLSPMELLAEKDGNGEEEEEEDDGYHN